MLSIGLTPPGFDNEAVEWIDYDAHPIEEAKWIEHGQGIGHDPDRRALVIDPVELADLKIELDELAGCSVHVVAIAEADFGAHSVQHWESHLSARAGLKSRSAWRHA